MDSRADGTPLTDDELDAEFVHVTRAYQRAVCRAAAQDWIRELYAGDSSQKNIAARQLRAENARRSAKHAQTHWTRPTRTG